MHEVYNSAFVSKKFLNNTITVNSEILCAMINAIYEEQMQKVRLVIAISVRSKISFAIPLLSYNFAFFKRLKNFYYKIYSIQVNEHIKNDFLLNLK